LFIKNKTRSKWSVIFLVALLIYEAAAGFEMTVLGMSEVYCRISDILKIVTLVILLAGVVTHLKYYSIPQWVIFGLLGILCAICAYQTRLMAPILLIAFWINMAEVDLDDILYLYLIVMTAVFVAAVVLCLAGVFPDTIFFDGGHGLGFTVPNTLASVQMSMVLAYICLRCGKIKWYEWLVMAVFAVVIFYLSHSAFGIILSIIGIVIGIILNYCKNENIHKLIGIVTIIMYPVCLIASYVGVKLYESHMAGIERINEMLNGRLSLGAAALKDYGMKMFGQKIIWSIGDTVDPATGDIILYNIVDSSYLYIPINYGWILAAVIMCLYIAFAIYIYKTQKWVWTIQIIVILIAGMIVEVLISIPCNPTVIAIGAVFYNKYLLKDKGKEI